MAQELGRDASVFDFVYVDHARLGSLLAQLSDDGVVIAARKTSSHTGSNAGKLKFTAAIVSVDGTTNDSATETLERSFDTRCLLPGNALHVLQESGMLHAGLNSPLGSIVHIKGKLTIRDVELAKQLWAPLARLLVADEPPGKRKAKQRGLDMAGRTLKQLPPAVQFSLHTHDCLEAWGVLGDIDSMLDAKALGLKHGSVIQGEWHLVGVLDAEPDRPRYVPVLDDTGLMGTMAPIFDELRKLIGRPVRAHGITPLAIFRPCESVDAAQARKRNDTAIMVGPGSR